MNVPKIGDLRVWWIPQVPMEPFFYPVESPEEGAALCDALAKYDMFQYENNVKPDYCNVGGLQVYEYVPNGDDPDDDGWCDWTHPETFQEFDEFMEELIEKRTNQTKEQTDG